MSLPLFASNKIGTQYVVTANKYDGRYHNFWRYDMEAFILDGWKLIAINDDKEMESVTAVFERIKEGR